MVDSRKTQTARPGKTTGARPELEGNTGRASAEGVPLALPVLTVDSRKTETTGPGKTTGARPELEGNTGRVSATPPQGWEDDRYKAGTWEKHWQSLWHTVGANAKIGCHWLCQCCACLANGCLPFGLGLAGNRGKTRILAQHWQSQCHTVGPPARQCHPARRPHPGRRGSGPGAG